MSQTGEPDVSVNRGTNPVDFVTVRTPELLQPFDVPLTGMSFDADACELQMSLTQASGCSVDPGTLPGCDTLLELDGQYYQLNGMVQFADGITITAQGPSVTNCRLSSGNPLPTPSGPTLNLGTDSIGIVQTSVAIERNFDGTILHVQSAPGNVICDGETVEPISNQELVFRTSFERGLPEQSFSLDGRRFEMGPNLNASLNGENGIVIDTPDIPVLDCTNPGIQPVATISADNLNVMSGDSVMITWSATNAVACEAFGGGSSAWATRRLLPPSGAETVQINGNPMDLFNFTIMCVNQVGLENNCLTLNCAANADQDQVTVEIGDSGGGGGGGGGNGNDTCPDESRPDCFPPPPAFCGAQPAGRSLPFTVMRNQQFFDFRTYNEVWNPDFWPDSADVAHIMIPAGGYVALPFTAQPAGAAWRGTWADSPTSGTAVTASISRCPGDFTNSLGDGCLVTTGPFGAITAIVGNDNLACDLVQGETYYWNLRNTDGNGNNACLISECEVLARPARLIRMPLR